MCKQVKVIAVVLEYYMPKQLPTNPVKSLPVRWLGLWSPSCTSFKASFVAVSKLPCADLAENLTQLRSKHIADTTNTWHISFCASLAMLHCNVRLDGWAEPVDMTIHMERGYDKLYGLAFSAAVKRHPFLPQLVTLFQRILLVSSLPHQYEQMVFNWQLECV